MAEVKAWGRINSLIERCNWTKQQKEALSRMYIVRIFFISPRLEKKLSERSLWLQHKRLQLDDLLTNRKHIIQSESHKEVEEGKKRSENLLIRFILLFAIAQITSRCGGGSHFLRWAPNYQRQKQTNSHNSFALERLAPSDNPRRAPIIASNYQQLRRFNG